MRDFLFQAWGILAAFAPWLLLGLAAAGLLHTLLPADFVRRHLGRPGPGSVIRAALLGVPLPLCSCGVIPATFGLKKDGASDGAAVAFLISTPQTGVDSIAVSAAFLGWPFALFKVAAAFVTGVLGGLLADGSPGNAGGAPPPGPSTAPHPPPTRWREFWHFTVVELLGGMWGWLVLGVLISALISTVFPPDSLADRAWLQGPWGMLLMLAIALPLYVCATGSVPIAASLVAAGLPPGAALVFLMAGPASNAATIGAVYRALGRRVTVIYLGVIASASLLLGALFDGLVGEGYRQSVSCHAAEAASLWDHAWAALLLALFAGFLIRQLAARCRRLVNRRRARTMRSPGVAGDEVVLQVTGMTCQNCVRHVVDALSAQPGVTAVAVDLAAGRVRVNGHGLAPASLAAAVVGAGYGVTPTAG